MERGGHRLLSRSSADFLDRDDHLSNRILDSRHRGLVVIVRRLCLGVSNYPLIEPQRDSTPHPDFSGGRADPSRRS